MILKTGQKVKKNLKFISSSKVSWFTVLTELPQSQFSKCANTFYYIWEASISYQHVFGVTMYQVMTVIFEDTYNYK